MSLPLLVDGAVLAAVATPPVITAPGAPTVSGSSTNVFSVSKAAILLSDIEAATTPPQSYTSGVFTIPGTGHFENFVPNSGDTTKFFDSSDELYLQSSGGTCDFKIDVPAGQPPTPTPDPTTVYPGTWTVTSTGQTTVYLEASP